jgi:hypothetical protein
MTIKQAQDINLVFASQKSEIARLQEDLQGMRFIADSLATSLLRTNVTLHRTKQDLILQKIKSDRMLNKQSQLFFGFWAAFISYLELTK